MLSENGFDYLLVSGECEAWVLKEPQAPLRQLTLSREQARSLARDFRLGEWTTFPPAIGGCPDASAVSFRFDKDRLSGVPCGLNPGHPLLALSNALHTHEGTLYAGAIAVDGDVRYVLAFEDPNGPPAGDAYRDAPLWPLSSSPTGVAVPLNELYSYRRGTSQRASGEEASQLRTLRSSWLEGAIGSRMSAFIPVVGTDGARFQLYVRDSSRWENASGLIPDDLTSH